MPHQLKVDTKALKLLKNKKINKTKQTKKHAKK